MGNRSEVREKEAKEATDVRLTFRTHKTSEAKLERIARARGLTIGERYSVGAAINYVIDKYDDTVERKKLGVRLKVRRS
jgi:hypothetical protein